MTAAARVPYRTRVKIALFQRAESAIFTRGYCIMTKSMGRHSTHILGESIRKEDLLAKVNYNYEKRQREIAKKKKKEEKQKEKLNKKTVKPQEKPVQPEEK